MFSRIRENVQHIFDCFCEVSLPTQNEAKPWTVSKFPDSYQDEGTLKMVPLFAFPCDFERTTVQHSSFVLTSLDSKWTFGFCRHSPDQSTALVLLSPLPWHDTFFKLLNLLSRLAAGERRQLWSCLQRVYAAPVPERGGPLAVEMADGSLFSTVCTDHLRLPRIPQDRNLTEYFNAVDTHNMMVMFASMLYERRIVITSRRLSRLSACVQAANAIIYPMSWQHIFIPILPAALMDYLSAPMPFLIGVPAAIMKRVRPLELGDAVVLDADDNHVTSPYNDLDSLPADVVSALKRNLKNPNNMLGDRVARCFLRALVQLIGGYRDALKFPQNCSKITFDQDVFVRSRPSHMQPFLEEMLQLQIFHQFISERLDMLNSGQGFSDEFELEACVYLEKSSSRLSKQYKDWLSNVKKDGGAFLKNVRSKTNPAIRSAVRNVVQTSRSSKQKVRSAYRDIRGRIRDSHQQPTAADGGESGGSSAPTSPSSARRRPVFHTGVPSAPDLTDAGRVLGSDSPAVRHYRLIDDSDVSPPDAGDGFDGFRLPTAGTRTLVDEMTDEISRIEERVCEDLIKLDSFDDADMFDPLKSSGAVPSSLSNPIYPLYVPGQRGTVIGAHPSSAPVASSREPRRASSDDLLRDYGVDMTRLQLQKQPALPPKSLSRAPGVTSIRRQQAVSPSISVAPALLPPRPVFRSVATIRQKYEAASVGPEPPQSHLQSSAPPPLPPKSQQWTTFE